MEVLVVAISVQPTKHAADRVVISSLRAVLPPSLHRVAHFGLSGLAATPVYFLLVVLTPDRDRRGLGLRVGETFVVGGNADCILIPVAKLFIFRGSVFAVHKAEDALPSA